MNWDEINVKIINGLVNDCDYNKLSAATGMSVSGLKKRVKKLKNHYGVRKRSTLVFEIIKAGIFKLK